MQLTRRSFICLTTSALATAATGALAACGSSQNVGTTTSGSDEYSYVEEVTPTEVTFPVYYFGEDTEEEATTTLEELGCTAITKNEDGSYTCTMPSDKYADLVDGMREVVVNSLEELPESEDFPNVDSVEYDDQFSQVTLHMSVYELGFDDIFTPYVPGMLAVMYQQIAAQPVHCSVNMVDPDGNDLGTMDFPEALEEGTSEEG